MGCRKKDRMAGLGFLSTCERGSCTAGRRNDRDSKILPGAWLVADLRVRRRCISARDLERIRSLQTSDGFHKLRRRPTIHRSLKGRLHYPYSRLRALFG